MVIFEKIFSKNKNEEPTDSSKKRKINSETESILISEDNAPIKVFLKSKREFTDDEKKMITAFMLEAYNSDKNLPLSSCGVKLMLGLGIFSPIAINKLDENVFVIVIMDD